MRVVTNNPGVTERYPVADFVPGSPVEVLDRVGALLGEGYRLVCGPVMGNLVMLRSPFRSVLLEETAAGEFPAGDFAKVADARERAEAMAGWKVPGTALEDYAFMDSMFLDRAVEECGREVDGPGNKIGRSK